MLTKFQHLGAVPEYTRSLFSLAKLVFFGLPIKKSFNSSSLAPAQEVHLGTECAIG
ncbi:hypothetical protein [Microcoleus sp. Pol7_B1]|uniref:hypothetical protein n=1 Tax=Microcoleus sp. Pol7_B1 TaxID=2818894 RepID=UPI002FD515F6